MKNLTFTLCFALLCSVGFAQTPSRKAPSKNNMVKEKASSEEKIKKNKDNKYPTKPAPNNQDVNKRAAKPTNTMVKEKANPTSEPKVKSSPSGISNSQNRASKPTNTMVKEKPSSSVEKKVKNPTSPGVSNEEKRASKPTNTMVKEKPSSSVEQKTKYPTKPGVSNEEKRASNSDKNFSPSAPTSSKGDKLQDKTSKSTPGKTDKKYTPNAPTSTSGNSASDSRASDSAPNTSVSSFCRGWKDGYVKGWSEAKDEISKPQEIPSCPEKAPYGCEDYKCGYSTGMQQGKIDARVR